jgi:gliding motility-associated-like protein
VYKYPAPGLYTVTLHTISLYGCESAISRNVFVIALPKADFSVARSCIGDSTLFSDKTSCPTGYLTQWQWDFGDTLSGSADSSSLQNPAHRFTAINGYKVQLITMSNFGCSDTVFHYVNVYDKPHPGFIYHQSCDPTTEVQFTDTSVQSSSKSPIVSYQWNFFQSDSSYLQNPVYRFPVFDSCYQVTLMVTDTNNCSNTDTVTVCLHDSLKVDFTTLNDSVCFGEDVFFYGTGKDIVSWKWDFGNGDSSVYQNPVYKYPAPGLYTVTLHTTSLYGCETVISHNVFVIASPKADFSIARSCIGDSTLFSDKTTCPAGYLTKWQWNFGDTLSGSADSSSLQNPGHRFTAINTYKTRLIATNNFGCSDTVFHYVNVYDKPHPGFIYHQSCDPATEVHFTDTSARSSSKSPIISYQWNFFQSDSSYLQNPVYRFPDFDSCYRVSLTVTDTNGCTNTDIVTVCLRDSLQINFTAPKACFNQRTFFNASYTPTLDSIAQYTWNFNDGSKEITTFHDTISHRFPHPGTYQVILSATDTNGCSIAISHEAIVDSLPTPNFVFTTPSCDQPTYFVDSSQGNGNFISTWKWNFGDVASGTENYSDLQNPNHLYVSHDSIYQVKLIVTNFNGCTDSIIKPVQRYTCMKVLFTTSSSTECANNPLYFNDLTTLHSTQGNITKWTWDFGDGNIISYDTHKDSILHIYQESGHYNVTLKVDASINNMPFSNQYDSTIIIFNPPIANFVSSKACSSRTVYFTDSTQSGDASLTQWNWTFNDPYASENSSALQNPEHIYDSAGTYPTQLIVTDQHNCHDTISKPVVVHPTPKASFDMTTNANGVTGQVLMHNTSTGASTYFWNFGDGGTSTEENPLYQYSSVGIFHILLIATSQYQCSDSATTTYDLTSGLYVPNSFAPNSNTPSTNIFLPKGVHLKEYQIQIFSSWGNLLWESNKLTPNGEPAEGWDGTYKGKPMPAGTYIWRIKAKFLNGQIWQGSDNGDGHIKPYGTLTLIR